jgi:hypothetical protein
MSLTNPPPAVTALRDMLLACTSVTGAGIATGNIWYPSAVAESDDATAVDALPRAIIGEESFTRSRYAEGARGIPSGTLGVVLQVDTDVGTIETLARSIVDDLELLSHSQGLANVRCTVGLAAEPDKAQIAADDTSGDTSAKFATITMTVDYGLTA